MGVAGEVEIPPNVSSSPTQAFRAKSRMRETSQVTGRFLKAAAKERDEEKRGEGRFRGVPRAHSFRAFFSYLRYLFCGTSGGKSPSPRPLLSESLGRPPPKKKIRVTTSHHHQLITTPKAPQIFSTYFSENQQPRLLPFCARKCKHPAAILFHYTFFLFLQSPKWQAATTVA